MSLAKHEVAFEVAVIRIINARRASGKEKRHYVEDKFDRIHDEMLPKYDFSGGVRGKYSGGRTTVMVRLDADVAAVFATSSQVNAAFRQLISEGRVPSKGDQAPSTTG